ncbi:Protein of unknown function DUF357 [Methanosalsum zhilinae DSM 4017]|uniref:DUF357 domain-containing protein n=1 Tax=Methanosalsum zhilinae (strain DSM 4017 / NBRC 107636 / OCM 62 / WeN5) TaxID=679901 RepID=F7XKM4_METZD|nr:Protein of unknown function DUF357 [Methanosalsum zhilinae DSM 4017]
MDHGDKLAAELAEKVNRYEKLLNSALEKADYAPIEKSHLHNVAEDFYTMALSYYKDGKHFMQINDLVNALVCFSYGHAWLDSGARLGLFDVDDDSLFTI